MDWEGRTILAGLCNARKGSIRYRDVTDLTMGEERGAALAEAKQYSGHDV